MSGEDGVLVLAQGESIEQLVELVESKFLELLEENLATETPSQAVSQEVFDRAAKARELAPVVDALSKLREIAQAIDNTSKVTIH